MNPSLPATDPARRARWSRSALVFLIGCALGAMIASWVPRTPRPNLPRTPATEPTAPSADAGADSGGGDTDRQEEPRWPDSAGTPEQVWYAQPERMRQALAALALRTPGKVNLYLIAFAGDGEEDVFRNEAEYVARLFRLRFDAEGHTLLLVNHPATLDRLPLASLSNLEAAVAGLRQILDPERDILLVLLTSHGSADHVLYVSMDPLPLDQISADDLVDLFAKYPIKNKVLILSACYSGGFIDALRSDTTMIITAARADRASFGCSSDSTITDFGRALFVEGLNHHDAFETAFAEARRLVDAWETRDGKEHSYPELVAPPSIVATLHRWRAGIRLGPPVPFELDRHTDPATLTVAR